ncbi:GAF and ANTAR domain-containing protein [Mycobacterium sp. NPDC004974]
MNPSDPVSVGARFLEAFRGTSTHKDEPSRLCEACVAVLPVTRSGISVSVEGVGIEVLCASDRIAERVEWTQVTLGEGPGMEAIASGAPVIVADIAAAHDRWPMFANDAVDAGVAAMYALPLQVGAIQVGVLDLYRDGAAELAAVDFANAIAIAEIVTAILLGSGRGDLPLESLGSLWDQPLGTREVHQATGMVVVQLGVSAREAYVRLQAYAFSHGMLLSQVAHAIVHRQLRFNPDPDPDPEAGANPNPSVTT